MNTFDLSRQFHRRRGTANLTPNAGADVPNRDSALGSYKNHLWESRPGAFGEFRSASLTPARIPCRKLRGALR